MSIDRTDLYKRVKDFTATGLKMRAVGKEFPPTLRECRDAVTQVLLILQIHMGGEESDTMAAEIYIENFS